MKSNKNKNSVINFNVFSNRITGSVNKIRNGYTPKDYKKTVEPVIKAIEEMVQTLEDIHNKKPLTEAEEKTADRLRLGK